MILWYIIFISKICHKKIYIMVHKQNKILELLEHKNIDKGKMKIAYNKSIMYLNYEESKNLLGNQIQEQDWY